MMLAVLSSEFPCMGRKFDSLVRPPTTNPTVFIRILVCNYMLCLTLKITLYDHLRPQHLHPLCILLLHPDNVWRTLEPHRPNAFIP